MGTDSADATRPTLPGRQNTIFLRGYVDVAERGNLQYPLEVHRRSVSRCSRYSSITTEHLSRAHDTVIVFRVDDIILVFRVDGHTQLRDSIAEARE